MNKRDAILWAEEQAKLFRNTLWFVTKISKRFECVSPNLMKKLNIGKVKNTNEYRKN